MAYASYEDYKALYGDTVLTEAGFTRLCWEAERAMDDATTGAGYVCKLRLYPPEDEAGREAVRRCACALVETLWQIELTETDSRLARTLLKRADGTVHSAVVASVSSGSESISYATGGAARSGITAIDTAAGDPAAKTRLLEDTARRYLAGVTDANGVNLLYMGRYPRRSPLA